ncbi:MAG: cyclopropane fatty acyl phospholipid synthase [Bacteroidetes bacterium]|nr:cyclopropane fatty acyl phospholipid synthase [Bacteroidota bacterium]
MKNSLLKKTVESLLREGGITINGDQPQDIQVHDNRLYNRVISKGSLGLGEAYMDGWWDCEKLDDFFYRINRFGVEHKAGKSWAKKLADLKAFFFNMQNQAKSKISVREHYDISNEFYMSFLDPYNQYTCGYFRDTDELDRAQEDKLDLICKKLDIHKEDRVLDIGCGWGGFSRFAAEKYGYNVTGITISDQQLNYATEYCKDLPVTLKKMDYRDLSEKFDKILICGMIEHVGYKNYRRIMEVVHQCLNDSGKFLLQTIGARTSTRTMDPWMSKYIFPNAMLPSMKQLSRATEGLFVMEDWQNFGAYYDQTLMAWYENFKRNWSKHKSKYNERFYRMWEYYLLSSAASFRARKNQLWQIVFTPNGQPGVFRYMR